MKRLGSNDLAVVRPTRVYLQDSFCSGIQLYVLLSPYLCVISFYLPRFSESRSSSGSTLYVSSTVCLDIDMFATLVVPSLCNL